MGLRSLFRRHDDDNDEASSSSPPPSYSDADKSHDHGPPAAQDAPSYERPTYPGDSTIVPATLKFPPRLNVYLSWKSGRTFHLGTSGEEKLFAVSTSWAVMGMNKPLLTIYDGPEKTDPVLAETSPLNYTMNQRSTITLPPGAATNPGTAPLVINLKYEYSLKTIVFSFTLAVPPPPSRKGDPPQEEAFEWRSTFGDEVKHLTGGSVFSSGWKLVRLWGPENRSGAGGGYRMTGTRVAYGVWRSRILSSGVFRADAAGYVEQVGENVTHVQVGQHVMGYCMGLGVDKPAFGAYQKFLFVFASLVAPIPDDVSFEQAAVLPLALTTVAAGLYHPDHLTLPLPNTKPVPVNKGILVWGGSIFGRSHSHPAGSGLWT
ncbi:hypothetical protein BN1708_011522 [Verticillium longisporum]|uniref:Alcohol dehydrogenase-like N-terminal domain-containing protein n=1 Tax=Verticillium longisporum TaxID=100787 RepID=A0A0G4L106_VERLO|nr:hypothetical protein BN1708_011522 [Verticillium longisporum]